MEEAKDELSVWSGDTLAHAIASGRQIVNLASPANAMSPVSPVRDRIGSMQQLIEES